MVKRIRACAVGSSVAAWAGMGVLGVGSALGQAPSFTQIPSAPLDIVVRSVSPNGRYISATTDPYPGTIPGQARWDRSTGTYSLISTVIGGHIYDSVNRVLDDGAVYGARYVPLWAPKRLCKWTPETSTITDLPVLSGMPDEQSFNAISDDAAFILGSDYFGVSPFLLDRAFPISVGMYSTGGYLRSCEVTRPINGLRFVYTSILDGPVIRWVGGSAQGTIDPTWTTFADVSPGGELVLGTFNGQVIVRGDGADRVLGAPTQPVLMSSPSALQMSDDAGVVVGSAVHPLFGEFEAVVWRKGSPAAALRDVMSGVGVALPTWDSSWLTGVSADGSVAAGTFTVGDAERGFVVVLPSGNDTCETARAVTYGTTISSTNGATRAGVSGGCHSEGAAPDVWFRFVPAANETVSIDTCGSSFDTTLTVFQASTCASLGSPVACNDDAVTPCADNVHASRISTSVFANQNYYIRVSGWNGAFGSIKLTITAPNRPANDACAQATNVPVGGGVFWNNTGAITDNRPNCSGTPFGDIYFRTVPTESGRMTYSTCGSTINTVNQVFPSGACGDPAIAPAYCSQGNAGCGGSAGSRLTVPCAAGIAQIIRVGGLSGATGSGQFTARFACDQNNLSGYSQQVVNDGARAYWRFDDSGSLTVADAVRSDPFTCGNYPGEYMNGAVRIDSHLGKALDLNGTGAYVRADVVPGLRVTDPAVCEYPTLEAWIRTTDPLAGVVMTSRNAPGEHSLTMVVGYNPIGMPNTQGRVMFISDGPGVLFGGASIPRVDDGAWHHVVGRRVLNGDGNLELQVFVDGVANWYELPGVGFTYSGVNGQYWTVGNGLAWPEAGAAFNGRIDEVAIYCGTLSTGAIANHFAAGSPPACDTIDFNGDGLLPDVQDIADFVAVFGGAACPTGTCGDIDFNNDGLFPDIDDINALIRVFGGGDC